MRAPQPSVPASGRGSSVRPSRLLSAAVVAAAVVAGGCGPFSGGEPEAAASSIRAAEIEAHLRFLAHDLLEGRGPGTRGGRLAGQYIASRFRASGLEPVDGSYFQPVPVVGSTPRPDGTTLSVHGGGGRRVPQYLRDFVLWSGDPRAASVRGAGELVFVGYGISAPEEDWDDFADAGMDGKVLLVLVNDPPAPPDDPDRFGGRAMTYYGRWTYKFEEAARQGALGALIVHTTDAAGYPWSVVRGSWSGEQFSLPPGSRGPPPVPLQGWLTRAAATGILEMAGLELDSLMSAAGSPDFRPVPTGLEVRAAVQSTVRGLETRNVVGLARGASRADEVITVTSHYDHLGIGEPVAGDGIYNGAYDNASGTGLLLEIADAFGSLGTRPARSVLFVATAAEEAGLLGAEAYVQEPLFPLERTVAEINVDGANLWGETDDLIAMGADRSQLGAVVEARARELGMELAPDAEPEKGYFFRSDHFPFARAGVPSLYLEHGRRYRGRPEGWGQRIQEEYTAQRYHAPSDEVSEEFVYQGAVQQGRLAFLTAWDLATGSAWPTWHGDSEFRAARDAMMDSSRAEDGGG